MIGRYLLRYGYRIVVGLLMTGAFALHASNLLDIPLLRQIESIAYDERLRLTMSRSIDTRIVIVDVDEYSLSLEGRWPWSRSRIALLVDHLFQHYGVRVVGFDMVFAEPESRGSIEQVRQAAGDAGRDDVIEFIDANDPHPDQLLADSFQGRDVVLGYYFSAGKGGGDSVGRLPEPLLPAEIAQMMDVPALSVSGYGANLDALQSAARAGGFFDNSLNDTDGVFRRIPLIQEHQGDLYASLALAVSELALGESVQFSDDYDFVTVGGTNIPVDGAMAVLIPYRGAQGSFPYVSAADVLRLEADPGVLDGAIVLIGTTAPGLFDLRNTPVQKIYPGVEIHANVVSGILDNRFLSRPDYTIALEILQILLIGMLLSFLLPSLGPIKGALLTLGFLGITVGLDVYFFVIEASVVPVSAALLLIVLHYIHVTSYGFIVESRNKKALMVQFGRYVPEEIVDEMSRQPGDYSLKGQRRELSVMFADIRDFTRLSETLEPQVVSQLINTYLNRMTEVIHSRHGTIDKYMGDAIMAFWGAPLEDSHHASRAVDAALQMRDLIPSIHEDFRQLGWPAIRIGIGINTGYMAVGNMGSDFRMAYTVMGDAVNLGSRVEGLNKIYGTTVIVTGHTVRQASEFRYRQLDKVRVRGRGEVIEIFEPLVRMEDVSDDLDQELELFDAFLGSYRQKDWARALAQLGELDQLYGKKPLHGLYRDRINGFQLDPPAADWDGSFDPG